MVGEMKKASLHDSPIDSIVHPVCYLLWLWDMTLSVSQTGSHKDSQAQIRLPGEIVPFFFKEDFMRIKPRVSCSELEPALGRRLHQDLDVWFDSSMSMFMGKGNVKLGSDVKPHTMVAAGWEGCAAGTHHWAAEGLSETATRAYACGNTAVPTPCHWLIWPVTPLWGASTVVCAAEEEIGLAFHLLWGGGHYKLDSCMLVVRHLLRKPAVKLIVRNMRCIFFLIGFSAIISKGPFCSHSQSLIAIVKYYNLKRPGRRADIRPGS